MPHDNQTEIFYWVNEHDEVLGKITRAEAHSGTKKIHRSVYLLLINQKDEMLMQKRSKYKDTFPGFWTVSTSGHVTYPDTYEHSLVREAKEEIGVRLRQFEFVATVHFESEQEREIGKIYVSKHDDQPIRIDSTEIEKCQWVGLKKLAEWSLKHPLTSAAKLVLQTQGFI